MSQGGGGWSLKIGQNQVAMVVYGYEVMVLGGGFQSKKREIMEKGE